MPTIYQTADADVLNLLARVLADYHPRLAAADVRVGVLTAYNPDGDAVRHGGYAAFAAIKPVSAKDRVPKGYDAELVIDERKWAELHDEQRVALLDHELSHLDVIDLSPAELKAARAESADAPTWKTDDRGRPKLRSVPGDWNAGDGFTQVVARHGLDAVEYANLQHARGRADAARLAGDGERQAGA